MELKMSTMMDVISDVDTRRETAYADISGNVNADIRMMTYLLKKFATEDGYDGPRVFPGGLVAELQGERVVFPQKYLELEKQVSREQIEEIGVRSTRLRVSGNNTMILNNHQITSVLNKSKELSKLSLVLRIPMSESMVRVEEILNRELPDIGTRTGLIKGGPYLFGVTGLSGAEFNLPEQIISLTVEAMYNAKDEKAVKAFLNREIRLLFEREGIELL